MTSVPQIHPPGAGWADWCGSPPYRHYTLVEAWRASWQSVEVIRISDLHPAFNFAGLYWRPLQRPVLEPEIIRYG